jgi:hypothetical protein
LIVRRPTSSAKNDLVNPSSVTLEVTMRWLPKNLVSRLQLFLISGFAIVLLGACAGAPEQKDWIKIGQTTREEVVKQYGQPDLVMASEEGETAIYRPRDSKRSTPQVEIPTMQVGPLGTMTTKMEPINPGSGTRPMNGGLQQRPEQELRIRYNAQGIVQELIR